MSRGYTAPSLASRAGPAIGEWIDRREPAAILALLLWVAEAGADGLGYSTWWLTVAAMALVPGLCVLRLLPRDLDSVARAAAVPIIGLSLASLAVISIGAAGVPVTELSLRLALLAPALLAVLWPHPQAVTWGGEAPNRDLPMAVATATGLAAAVALGASLQQAVIGGSPVPGNDWGHYLLYAEEIASQGSLLIDNPFWMLGTPFREDPGAPALYGMYLILSGDSAPVLNHGIWFFAALGPVAVFILATGLAGRVAGVVAAAVYATVPINQTILAWHGLANVYALVFVPLGLLAAAMVFSGRRDPGWGLMLGLTAVAVAAAHRLTFAFLGVAVAVAALALMAGGQRPRVGNLVVAGLIAAAAGVGLAADLLRRNEGAGGVQDYTAYLRTKIDWDLVVADLTPTLSVIGAVAVATILSSQRMRKAPGAAVLAGLTASTALLAWGWVLHLPNVYYRAAYYLPLGLALAIGLAAGGAWLNHNRLRPVVAVLLVVMVAATVARADGLTAIKRDYYAWVDEASAAGLDRIRGGLNRDDVVVTDRCWSFLTPWLLRQPTLAALDDSDIQPAAELEGAAMARRLLYGPAPTSRLMARYLGVRYALTNPTCADSQGRVYPPPHQGRPIYASERLVVMRLPGRGRTPFPQLIKPVGAAPLLGPDRPLLQLEQLRQPG